MVQQLSRRRFLQAAGTLTVIVAGGGVWRSVSQGVFSVGQGPAYEPWTDWRTAPAEGALRLVQAGILASNPHNSQPWLFRVSENTVELYADTSRQIGTIDPFLREMYTGLGCALENMLLTAQAEGYTPLITYLPEAADETLAARIVLTPAEPAPSPLYDAIPNRRTDRHEYDTSRPLPQAVLDRLSALSDDADVKVIWVTDDALRARIGEQIVAATEALITDEQQSIDSHRWWRQDWSQLHELRDGITPDAGQTPSFAALIKLLPDSSRQVADEAFLAQTRDRHVATAMGYGFIVVRNNRANIQRLRGGRLWQRLHLQGTLDGLGMQPLNQMPERADREAQLNLEPRFTNFLAEVVGDPEFQVLMPFRLGYPTVTPNPAPRRPVDFVLL